MKQSSKANLYAIFSILLWCWSGICFRKGAEAVGAMVYLTFMTGTGALTVVVMQLLRRQPLQLLYKLSPKVIISGLFGVTLYTVILAYAFGIAPEGDLGQVNLLNYFWPVWIIIFGIFLLKKRPHPIMTLAGILAGFAGIALSRGFANVLHLPGAILPHILALGGGMLWALYSVLLRRWNIPSDRGGTAFLFTICALMAAIIAGITGQWQNIGRFSLSTLLWVLFGGIGPVGIAYHLWEIGVKKGNVQLLASFAYFIPVGSSLLIGLFFKEAMSAALIPGALLITGGSLLTHFAGRKAKL